MNAKKFYATFVSLMLAIVMIMCTVVIVHADVFPGVPPYPAHPGKLMAVVGNADEPGFYGGYWAMWDLIMPSLNSTIGFSSAVAPGWANYWPMPDDWSLHSIIWGLGWRHHTQDTSSELWAPYGWDLTSIEWRLMPTGMLWMDSLILGENAPPTSRNIFPYFNSKSDDLYWKYQSASVAAERKSWIDAWQFELMRNPPIANVYYPYTYDVYGDYVKNWYGTVWWYDIDNLAIDSAEVLEAYNDEYMTLQDRDRLLAGTLKYGVTEDWWNFNPLFVATHTEETMANIISHTLYSLSLREWPSPGQPADPTKYYIKPDLAAGPPILSEDRMVATIPLKQGITWSDGVPFNASDVKFTLDLNLNHKAKAVARGDFTPIVKEVNIVNETAVELVLHRPYADLECILSNSWGLAIVPWHSYKDIAVPTLRGDETNWDWTVAKNIPVIGPFKLEEATVEYLKYVKNPDWWGNDYGYTIQDTVNEIYLVRGWGWDILENILTHQIDFGEHQWGPIPNVIDRPDLTVFERPYLASNGVWFNINNPYLSNRYVRLAISHAIPYDDIRANVLPGWGVSNWTAGGTFVHPWMYCTDESNNTVGLFNTAAPDYTYNPTLAQSYLDMWKLSRIAQAPNPYTPADPEYWTGDWVNGPVGDANFDGIVDLDDFLLWIENLGNTEAGHEFLPGNDEDADFDNDNAVGIYDYLRWTEHTGDEYPPAPHTY